MKKPLSKSKANRRQQTHAKQLAQLHRQSAALTAEFILLQDRVKVLEIPWWNLRLKRTTRRRGKETNGNEEERLEEESSREEDER